MSEIVEDTKSSSGPDLNEKGVGATVVTDVTASGAPEHAVKFSLFSIISLAYCILNSWTAMSASISLALPSGGPTAVIWGIIPSAIGNLGMVLSLAEICHVYPTSGGQYHWSYILSPPKYAALFSWICGWFSVAGWIALTATASSLAGSLITGMISLVNEDYNPLPYQIFLIYVLYAVLALILNIWGLRLLPLVNRTALIWSLAGAATIMVTCLATASKTGYQPASFVFGGFVNDTGYSGGVAWILGLLQSSFGLTAYDGVTHMVEEMPDAARNAPFAMVLSVIIGAVSSFFFLVALLFSINDVDALISSSAGPLLAAFYQATSSKTAALCLQIFPVVSMFFAAQGILLGSSRMTHSFARDGGLPFSAFFARQNSLGVPVQAVFLSTSLVIAFGLIYLGSSTALNAILSSSVVFLNISYCIPISLLLIRGRHLLRPEGYPVPTMTLGPIFGIVCNIIGLVFTAVTTVFFLFPPAIPVDATSMNYAIVVFGIIFFIAFSTWFYSGKKNFSGPKDLNGLLALARSEAWEGERNGAWEGEKGATTF